VPYPPNYGGVIDVFYKLVWLKKSGVKVYLHCFTYGRSPSKELEAICEEVYYYPRKTGIISNLSYLPYTVRSRQSAELEKNLLSNDYPILFEVLHTCYLINDPRFSKRIKIYRHSNIEHVYYYHLAKAEKNLLKRAYLKIEARKLERFEMVIESAQYILAVNEEDSNYFSQKYSSPKTIFIPSFHPNTEPEIKPGKGNYILYHGNLSVSENYEAADWLITNVFNILPHKVIIAGLNAPDFLKKRISENKNIELVENPSEEKMNELIANAHIHCLYTHQATGLKLKLLNVLFKGRFVVCNPSILSGTKLGNTGNTGLYIAENRKDFTTIITDLVEKEFTSQLADLRVKSLGFYSNQTNITKLLEIL